MDLIQPKIVSKWTYLDPKIVSKWTNFDPKMDPKDEMYLKLTQIELLKFCCKMIICFVYSIENCPLALKVFSIGYLDCWTMIIVVLFMRCNLVGQSKAARGTQYYCRKSRRKYRTHVVNHINLMANEQNPIYSTQKHSSMITSLLAN